MKIYTYPSISAKKKIASIVNRGTGFKKKDLLAVTRIIEDVRKNKDQALIRYTNQFDSPKLTTASIRVTRQEIEDASKRVDRPFLRTLVGQ